MKFDKIMHDGTLRREERTLLDLSRDASDVRKGVIEIIRSRFGRKIDRSSKYNEKNILYKN